MLHILTNTYQVIDPLFGRSDRPVELDMGCGRGKFVLDMAERFPDRMVIGTDVMMGRLRKILKKATRRGFENFELLRANHLDIVGFMLPDNTVDRIHLLCPDPWPKARHRSKRIFMTDFFVRAARILKQGGVLHVATDHPPYHEVLFKVLEELPFLESTPEKLDDIRDLKTDFEIQWLEEGKEVPHLCYTYNPQ